MVSDLRYNMKGLELISNDIQTYQNQASLHGIWENIYYYCSKPVRKSITTLRFAIRRTNQIRYQRCKNCNNFSSSWYLHTHSDENQLRGFVRENEMRETIKAILAGCSYCQLIAHSIHLLFPEYRQVDIGAAKIEITSWEGRPIEVDLTIEGVSDHLAMEFYSIFGFPRLQLSLGSANEIPTFANSEMTFHFLADCLQRCMQSHIQCRQMTARIVPARLIEIDAVQNSSLRLVESHVLSANTLYIALSHCWGQGDLFTTSLATLASRMESINWQDLSRVYQDALMTARMTGKKSRRSWVKFIKTPYFTIAAASSPDGSISFLSSPHEVGHNTDTFELPISTHNSQQAPVRVRRKSLAFSASDHEGPLSSRAWAWQEYVLSKRVMQFTAREVKWHCYEECRCECTVIPERGKLSLHSTTQPYLYSEWHELVSDYSGRKLSFESDRLPALSGVASLIQNVVSSEYVAGLWKNNLPSDLLWYSDPRCSIPNLVSSGHSTLNASTTPPSWSWASIDGKIRYLFVGHVVSHIEILGVRCQLAGLNPHGEVNGGTITMKARCFDALLQVDNPDDHENYKLSRFGATCFLKPDCRLELSSRTTLKTICRARTLKQDCDKSAPNHGTHLPFSGTVQCILGCSMKLNDGITSYQILIIGKSLLSDDCYERLGQASMCREFITKWLKRSEVRTIRLV